VTIDVLIVDDDFRVADVHARYVDSIEGFRTIGKVHTAAEALRYAARSRPDLVLLDNYLPDRPGISIAPALQADVLVVTADRSAETIRAAVRCGAVGIVVKPFDRDVLGARLQAYGRYRRSLPADAVEMTQEAIDRALAMLRPVERGTATATRSSVTARLVSEALCASPDALSATVLSERLGIARATAQRYLAALVDDGQAEVHLRYGSTGRPEHWYTWIRATLPAEAR
jgi:response regulator of citrate/malate metabolism